MDKLDVMAFQYKVAFGVITSIAKDEIDDVLKDTAMWEYIKKFESDPYGVKMMTYQTKVPDIYQATFAETSLRINPSWTYGYEVMDVEIYGERVDWKNGLKDFHRRYGPTALYCTKVVSGKLTDDKKEEVREVCRNYVKTIEDVFVETIVGLKKEDLYRMKTLRRER